jgi:hypothetical protein
MRIVGLLLAGLFLCLSCKQTTNHNQDVSEQWERVTSHDTSMWVNFGDIRLFDVVMEDSGHGLINGTVPQANDWPASFASRQSGSGCTATLIAENVLQLAAHCVGNGRTAQITSNGQTYTGTCTHAPGYNGDPTADWALCKMQTAIDRAWYEKVLQDASKVVVGGKLKLAGAGCTTPGGNDGAFGTFRVGDATITQIPSSDNDTVTKGGAALCFGDSGGSAFLEEANGQRWVVGVNSRGDIQTMSYLASVFTNEAKQFYSQWAQANGAKICGMAQDAVKCQGAAPIDPTPPLPPQCQTALDFFKKCLYDVPRLAITQPAQCRKAYADLFACEEAAEIGQ